MSIDRRLSSQPALRISLIYILFAGGWIGLSDMLLQWLVADTQVLSRLQTYKGGVFVLLTGVLLYILISRYRPAALPPARPALKSLNNGFPVLVFALLGVVIGTSGWYAFDAMRTSIRHEVQQNLANIGELKASLIESWVQERNTDLSVLVANGSQLSIALDAWMRSPQPPEKLAYVEQRVDRFQQAYHCRGMAVYDLQGVLRYSRGEATVAWHGAEARQVIANRKSMLVDFHRHDGGGIRFGFMVPLLVAGEVRGVLYASLAPEDYLYPLLTWMPGESRTGETELIRRDADQLLFLSPLRMNSAPPLALRLPLADRGRVAVQAAMGRRGVVQGFHDYRNVPVLGYVSAVNGTPWLLLSEIDEVEAYAVVNRLGLYSALALILTLALAGSAVWLWWARQQARFDALQRQQVLERQALELRYDALSRYANDMILITDDVGRLIQVNERALEVYGYSQEELLGQTIGQLRSPAAISLQDENLPVSGGGSMVYESEHQRKDGSRFPVEISARLIESGGQTFCHMVLRDISSRKRAEEHIRRLNRMYATLSQTNTTIVQISAEDKAAEEQHLYDEVCRIAVEVGGMMLAWVGRLDEATKCFVPVAQFGSHPDYLDGLQISLDPDLPEGQGPTGICMRENRAVIVNDFLNDPRTAPWQLRARQAGIGASLSYPVARNGRPYVAFMAYHTQAGVFDVDVVKLFDEMIRDIGFALEMLETKAQRQAALQKLQAARLVVESSPVVLWRWRAVPGYPAEYVSENVIQYGYSADEFISGQVSFAGIIHPDDIARVLREVEEYSARWVEHYSQKYRIVTRSGSVRWLDDRTIVIRDALGNITHYQGITNDITDQIAAERVIQEGERKLSTLMGNLPGMAYRRLDDHDWTMLFVSQGCQALTGYMPEDLVNNARVAFNDLIVEEDRKRLWDEAQAGLASGLRYQLNYRITTAQGEIRHVWEQAIGLRNAEGDVEAIEGLVIDVTRERLAETRMRDNEERFRSIFESVSDAVFLHDAATGKIIDANPRATEMYGYSHDEILGLDVAALSAGDPQYGIRAALHHLRQVHREHAEVFEWRARHKSGSLFWVEVAIRSLTIGGLERQLVTVTDIDARKQIELKLQLDAEVFQHSREGVVITDRETRILTVNPAFTEITGYTEQDALGQTTRLLKSDRHEVEFYRDMWNALLGAGYWQGEIWNRRKDGSLYPEWLSISRVLDDQGEVSRYIGIFTDISQRVEAELHIQHLAHFDPLTGLPNRLLLADRAGQAIRMAERKQEALAVMFLDLDHFKNINDTLGHPVGDELLIDLGRRLSGLIRDEDTVSRLGGDEFVLVLPTTDAQGAAHLAQKVMEAVAQPYHIEPHELLISASIGIAMYPADGKDFDNLSKCADTAMYRAKNLGRNTYCFFTAEMQEHAMRVQKLENALRQAMLHDELHLLYQPQVSLVTGQVVGVEALIRWSHPELGVISPSDFIPIAEDNGSILQIGEWVLRQAVQQVRQWREEGLPLLPVAVNLSAVQFRNQDLPALVSQVLDEAALPPEFLELELTESLAMGDPRLVVGMMGELHQRGVRMSIDDFGTGYSSLNYLRRFPVYKLKIDQSFVSDLGQNPEGEAIVRTIVSLSRNLGFRTIAEGVETREQLDLLREYGCDEIQGFYYSRPLPPQELAALLTKGISIYDLPAQAPS